MSSALLRCCTCRAQVSIWRWVKEECWGCGTERTRPFSTRIDCKTAPSHPKTCGSPTWCCCTTCTRWWALFWKSCEEQLIGCIEWYPVCAARFSVWGIVTIEIHPLSYLSVPAQAGQSLGIRPGQDQTHTSFTPTLRGNLVCSLPEHASLGTVGGNQGTQRH